MMIAFKGRSSFKQYVANKPIKRGFKLLSLCSYDGYVIELQVYTGASSADQNDDSLGSRIVLSLMEGFNHRGHIVYADRFFSSPSLAEDLLAKETFFTGTIKRNRKGFPKDLNAVHQRGDYDWKMKPNGLLAGVWKDSKEVPFISTASSPTFDPMPTCKRRINKEIVTIQIPPAIKSYNLAKSGVDIADQRRSYCQMRFKQLRRWWLPLFFALIDTCIENGRYIWNFGKPNKDQLSSKDYRLQLIDYLAPSDYSVPVRDSTQGHFPNHTETKNRRCHRCAEKEIERRTTLECRLCDVALCLNCFGPYHMEHS